MRRITLALALVLSLSIAAAAQNPVDEGFQPNLLRLSDDANRQSIFILKSDGTYFTNACPFFRVESFGQLRRKGCSVSLEEITPSYRVLMSGDVCRGTGKLVLQVFGVGVFTLIDRTID